MKKILLILLCATSLYAQGVGTGYKGRASGTGGSGTDSVLVAGTNVTLARNGNQITITASLSSGSGVWTRYSGFVRSDVDGDAWHMLSADGGDSLIVSIDNSGVVTFNTPTGTFAFSKTVAVTGDITVSGTVDGVDIAARDHDAVTLAGTPAYLTLSGQEITKLPIKSAWADSSSDNGLVTHVQLTTLDYLPRAIFPDSIAAHTELVTWSDTTEVTGVGIATYDDLKSYQLLSAVRDSITQVLLDSLGAKFLHWFRNDLSHEALANGDTTIYANPNDGGAIYKGVYSAAGGGDMSAATYDPGGVSEQLVGLTAEQTMTNKTLTSPIITTTPTVGNGATGPGFWRFLEDTDNGSNYIDLIGQAAIASNFTITLPGITGTVMLNLVEDTSPQLGGNLDLNSNVITGLEIGTDVLAQQTIGIANDNLLEVDGTPNSGEAAVFTANGINGLSEAEFKTAFNMEAGVDFQAFDSDLTTWAGITPGTGVGTALAVNVGTAGAFVVLNGAGGTPSAITLTNGTGLPISTGVSGLGANVATWLATPSSANLASAVTGETGSGALVFATSPTLVTPALGTPASGDASNMTNAQGNNEAFASGWNADTGAPEKDDVYDWGHTFDTDDDGLVNRAGFDTDVVITDTASITLYFLQFDSTITESDMALTDFGAYNAWVFASNTLDTLVNKASEPIPEQFVEWIGWQAFYIGGGTTADTLIVMSKAFAHDEAPTANLSYTWRDTILATSTADGDRIKSAMLTDFSDSGNNQIAAGDVVNFALVRPANDADALEADAGIVMYYRRKQDIQ